MSGHTPGPWFARQCGKAWAIDFNEDQEQVVDYVYEEADAHLIAAAPDLLEACEALSSIEHIEQASIGPLREALMKARAAIAKARGES